MGGCLRTVGVLLLAGGVMRGAGGAAGVSCEAWWTACEFDARGTADCGRDQSYGSGSGS